MIDYYVIIDKAEIHKKVLESRRFDISEIEKKLNETHDSIINHPENVRLRDYLGVLRRELTELSRIPLSCINSILYCSADGLQRFHLAGFNGNLSIRFAIVPTITNFNSSEEPSVASCNFREYTMHHCNFYNCGDVVHKIFEFREVVK